MGSSECKPLLIDPGDVAEIKISTADQFQYTFIPTNSEDYLIGIKAKSDAHVVLSSNETKPEYEILIGKSSNKNTELKKRGVVVRSATTPNILHQDEFHYFWLKWKDNKLLLGHEHEQQPFIYFNDDECIPIKYMGVCTNGSIGTWIIKNKSYEIVSQTEPIRSARNEPTTSSITTEFLSNTASCDDLSPPSTSICPTAPLLSDIETQEADTFPHLIRNRLNADSENTTKINNNIANTENINKTNPINYLNNLNNSNINNESKDNNLENLEKILLSANTATENNQTSKNKSRKSRNRSRKNKNICNEKVNKNPNENNFKVQSECDDIISFDKLLDISRKNPKLIIIELQPYKFERLFEIKLRKSYINVIVNILSKLCQAGKTSVITDLFSKEVFRKQLLNYMHYIRFQSEEDYNKHLRHNNEMWKSLYIVCKAAANIPAELQAGYLENFVFECQNALEALLCRDENRKNILEKFTTLKEYIHFEITKELD